MKPAKSATAQSAVKRPHVALVAHDLDPRGRSGMERVCTELIRRAANDIDFTVISRTLNPELLPFVRWRRVLVPDRPMPVKFISFFVTASQEIRRTRADIVHTLGAIVPNHTDVVSVHFCHAAYRRQVGRLAAPGSSWKRLNSSLSTFFAVVAERWSYHPRQTRVLAAVSSGIARELAQAYPNVPIVITPNGVDSDRFRPDPLVRLRKRTAEGCGKDDIVGLFVGGDWHRKRVEDAIAGLAIAQRQTEHRLWLWVVGRGDEAHFAALAQRAGVHERVRFFGVQAAPDAFYQAADVFVFPSLYEAFPLVTLEAAASGLPIIGTAINGNRDVIGNEEAGLYVRPEARDVGTALARLANDAGLRHQLAAEARSRATTFTWDSTIAGIRDIYQRLLSANLSGRA